MSTIVKVGMGDYKVAARPDILTTLGLGSCVGIALYEKLSGIIGLAHIMLPTMSQARDNQNIAKFADSAIPALVDEMIRAGAKKTNIVAKIAGGSQMFAFSSENDLMKIGLRNVVSTKAVLSSLNIPIMAEDTGGNCGRTIELYSEDGGLLIKTVGKGIRTV